MKLHSPQFEKTLRHGVRHRIKSSPALKREFRAANKFRRSYKGLFLIRPFVPFLLGVIVWKMAEATGHPFTALALISLWTFAAVFLHALGLWSRLFTSTDLAVLASLPVDESIIFRWQLQKFVRNALWSLADLGGAFAALAGYFQFSALKWLAAIAICILTWVLTMALAAFCAARCPMPMIKKASELIFVPVLPIFFVGKLFGWETMLTLLDRSAPYINFVLPTGWAVSLFQLLLPNPYWLVLALLVPVAAAIATVPASMRRLRGWYIFGEQIRQVPGDLVPPTEPAAAAEENAVSPVNLTRPAHLGPTAITDIVMLRQFLAPPQWASRGWFEKYLWRWFNPRERTLSEVVFPNGVFISIGWMKTFRTLAIAIALGFTLGQISPLAKVGVMGLAIIFTFIRVMTHLYYSGRTFQPVFCSGILIPIYANFGAGAHELARVMFKFTAVQIPPLFAWSVICGVLVAHLNDLPLTDGIMYGLRGGCLLFAGRFILVTFGFSSGTNDTGKCRLFNVLLIFCMLIFGALFLALGAIGLILPKAGWQAWLLTASAVVDAYLFFRVYAWFYHLNFFDLMSLPRR